MTNMIESYHWQLRKVTKGKSIFPTDEARAELGTNPLPDLHLLSGSNRTPVA